MSELGQWVARYRDGRRITKFHYVESEIQQREITRCGRQLKPRDGTVLLTMNEDRDTIDYCEQCS